MSTEPDLLLGLDVTSDDYATTAAHDQRIGADATPAAAAAEASTQDDSDAEREKAGAARAARMAFTEDDFLAQKESYTARVDEGDIWKQLLNFEPPFRPSDDFLLAVHATQDDVPSSSANDAAETQAKKKLDKKLHQTIQAAVSELYFLQKYDAVQEIVVWAKVNFEKDKKWDRQIEKWEGRLRQRMSRQEKE